MFAVMPRWRWPTIAEIPFLLPPQRPMYQCTAQHCSNSAGALAIQRRTENTHERQMRISKIAGFWETRTGDASALTPMRMFVDISSIRRRRGMKWM
jgi:hypothetical protein